MSFWYKSWRSGAGAAASRGHRPERRTGRVRDRSERVVTHGQALGRVVAGHGQLDDDPQGRPLGRRQLLVLERQQSGAGVVEAAQPGLEAGDVVLRPPLAELGAGRRTGGRRARPSPDRGARRSWRPGTRPAPGGRGCPSRRSGPGSPAWANSTQIRLRSMPSSRSSGGYSRASAAFQAANSQCGPSTYAGAGLEALDQPAQRRRHLVGRGQARRRAGAADHGLGERSRGAPGRRRRGAGPARSSAARRSEALIRRPCSSHVYQVTDTPASRATSSRRRPGVRRPRPRGSLTCSGVTASRRARRNSASSARCWSAIGVQSSTPTVARRHTIGTYQRARCALPHAVGMVIAASCPSGSVVRS